MKIWMPLVVGITLAGCTQRESKTIGSVERLDPALDAVIAENEVPEVIAEGHDWTEGPLWIAEQNMLLFSDIPKNSIFRWTEKNGEELYLKPSGYTQEEPSESSEPGSNGLLVDKDGNLVLCQHGDRRIARMKAPLHQPAPEFVSIAESYEGKKFNSPNDAVYKSNGDLYFTDPPYGLPKRMDDPGKEIPFQGVYRVTPEGRVTLLTDSLTRPNGIAFSPDEKTLIVANSDPDKAIWYAYTLTDTDSVTGGKILFDATSYVKAGDKGLPDGLKIARDGTIFATGPGGVWILDTGGKVLGRIRIPEATSNCALADDGKTLYMTSDMYVIRLKMRE